MADEIQNTHMAAHIAPFAGRPGVDVVFSTGGGGSSFLLLMAGGHMLQTDAASRIIL